MAMEKGTINNVSDTALWVAHYRAEESERPNALFQDPLAKILVGERGRSIAKYMKSISPYVGWTLAIRTYVIDRYIQNLVAEGIDTVLNLGAGLDTRPYRMKLPASLQWIEVDYPHMIDHKENLLAQQKPSCRLERVRLDLADGEKRRTLFQDVASRSKKVLILTEGVIPYLKEDHVAELADELAARESFRYWITEYFAPYVYKHLSGPKRMKRMANAPFQFFPADWFSFFRKHGWVLEEIHYLAEESIKLKRKIPAPWWSSIFRLFMNKKRAQLMLKMSGYVLFKKQQPN